MEIRERERSFSIELASRAELRSLALSSGSGENVLVEGTIGTLRRAAFREGMILEIAGSGGTLRVEVNEDDLDAARRRNGGKKRSGR
jgi:hypothetical protein